MKLPFEVDLSGKTIVVTGGSGVIGSELSRALVACGAKVAIIGLDDDKGKSLINDINNTESKGEVEFFQGDVTSRQDMEKVKESVNEKYGKISILINGAGGNHPKGTTEDEYYDNNNEESIQDFYGLDEESVGFVFDLNFKGTFIPTQVFSKDMVEQDFASIINISSMNAFTPLTKIPAYSGAKAAISNFTQWLSVYFSRTNIRVNAIAPGFLLTDQNRDLLLNDDGSYSDRAEKIINSTPLGRFGEPEELVGALLFLVNQQASSFVNGVVLPIDGGFNAYSGV
ncbi:SDR family NAD(P)-dependent oxidoreductase [Staphylococcus croceilyticus]|uniref:SDR family NAD(P)-dependent oxidoreductase n=1 Tax=Staphylococcus croceilyticus TaxID=319942 RepID=A0ABY2KID4_9STAP|nr:SDR family oxidoreductase [Staphylococcus croceilyticus]PNZ66244.1 D-mannonate oxidoreductase [Staphylococcus croceilyticus]TGA80582.1 SDR family NAD(P)-dependent oxidoreductase [Staphylococcus croceilyticus]